MAITNLTLSKPLLAGNAAKTIIIKATSIKEDYNNDLIIINPGKGATGQGVDITADNSASKTKIKNRLRLTHAVEIAGTLAYDGTNTAEYMKNLLFQMMIFGKEDSSEFEVTLTGLKKVNSAGTTAAVTLKGLINKVTVTEASQDVDNESEAVYDVQLQFIEGGAKDGFLQNRFQKT